MTPAKIPIASSSPSSVSSLSGEDECDDGGGERILVFDLPAFWF
jgi:hypothetical protein